MIKVLNWKNISCFNNISVLILFSYDINPDELLYIEEKNLVSRNILDFEDHFNIVKQAIEYGFLGLIF
mgnify:FL=1